MPNIIHEVEMSVNVIEFLGVIAAYLIGSVSFAVVVSQMMGLPNPHTYGSGNPGATNVLRTGNKKAAFLTLLGDALKGWVAVVLGKAFFCRISRGGLGDISNCAGCICWASISNLSWVQGG